MTSTYSVGHGTRTLDELVEVLKSADVELLVDVRRFPGSRRHPHFGKESLEAELPRRGVEYEWWGDSLGGRRTRVKGAASRHPAWRVAAFQGYADYMDTTAFRTALRKLEEVAAARAAAIMCAETLWWKCHRRLISDALVLRKHSVIHLINGSTRQEHVAHPAARPDEDGFPVYDVGTTPSLSLSQ